jgi:MYXO-CTERM domain-containing protein
MKEGREILVRRRCARVRLILAAAGAAATCTVANADPVTDRAFFGPEATVIDFERRWDGTQVVSADLDPLLEGETMPLPANEYASLGVTFGTDLWWVNDGTAAFDAAQILSGLAGQGGSQSLSIPSTWLDSFDLHFTTPVDAFGFFVADNWSEPKRAAVVFEAYDASDNLIDVAIFGGAFVDDTVSVLNTTAAYGFMGISRNDEQNPIARVSITKGAAILDDLVFTQVPTPGAVGMLGLAGALSSIRRRRAPR